MRFWLWLKSPVFNEGKILALWKLLDGAVGKEAERVPSLAPRHAGQDGYSNFITSDTGKDLGRLLYSI